MKRSELLAGLEKSRAAMEKAIAGLTDAEWEDLRALQGRSVRDAVQEQSIWEAEAIQMILHVRRGLRPPSARFRLSPEALRERWLASTRQRPTDLVLADFHGVRRQLIRQLNDLPGAELTRAPSLAWMQGRTLADWIAEDTYIRETAEAERIRLWRKVEMGTTPARGGTHAESAGR